MPQDTWETVSALVNGQLTAEDGAWGKVVAFINDQLTIEAIIDKHMLSCGVGPLPYTSSLDACAIAEAEIARRGLVRQYIDALMAILFGGGTRDVIAPYNSAIEISARHDLPTVPNNDFEWDGYAYLWYTATATPRQRCEAMVAVLEAL